MRKRARSVLHGAVIGLLALCATHGASAQEQAPPEVVAKASEAGVDPIDLLGAMNTTGLDAADYLCQSGEGSCPEPAAVPQPRGWLARVRLTHYTQAGITYSGVRTFPGATACSWNFPLWTKFRVGGEVFTCVDRGRLGSSGWLDLWRRPDLVARLGSYATVEVLG